MPTASPRELFRDAVARAVLAPSGRGALPCRFRVPGDDTLELRADTRRALTVADPTGREAIIGCGAALLHVSIVLQAAGHGVRVELLPDPAQRDLLARVLLDTPRQPTPADRALITAIHSGAAGDLPYDERAIAPHVLSLLLCAARGEGAWLGFVDAPVLRRTLAALVLEAHRRQRHDPRRRRERTVQAHRNDDAPTDGLPGGAAGLQELLSSLTPPVRGASDGGRAPRARFHLLVEGAPTVAVLMTRGDTRRDWMIAGAALARVLLTASAAGVAASYLNQPIEVRELRPRIAELVRDAADPGVPGTRGGMPADATPQIVLLLGYAPAAPVSPEPRSG